MGLTPDHNEISIQIDNLAATVHRRFDDLEVKLANTVQLAEVVARLFESDPHPFSMRSCQTCRSITALLGRSFGCVARAAESEAANRRTD
jgi:hypothetical protein